MELLLLQCRRLRDVIANKDHEVSSLRRQLDSTNEELVDVGRAREVALRENRRLQDDLSTMTRENQVSGALKIVQCCSYIIFFQFLKEMVFFAESKRRASRRLSRQ